MKMLSSTIFFMWTFGLLGASKESLLSEIQQGKKLKPISTTLPKKPPVTKPSTDQTAKSTIQDEIKKKLHKRRKSIDSPWDDEENEDNNEASSNQLPTSSQKSATTLTTIDATFITQQLMHLQLQLASLHHATRSLKSGIPEQTNKPSRPPTISGDLSAEIHQGKKLKPVPKESSPKSPEKPQGFLSEAIARLQKNMPQKKTPKSKPENNEEDWNTGDD